jgi:hypothetical protein
MVLVRIYSTKTHIPHPLPPENYKKYEVEVCLVFYLCFYIHATCPLAFELYAAFPFHPTTG